MKVLPKGKANVPGALIGFPVLEPNQGLGWSTCEKSHYFRELDVHLPRGEMKRNGRVPRGGRRLVEVAEWGCELCANGGSV